MNDKEILRIASIFLLEDGSVTLEDIAGYLFEIYAGSLSDHLANVRRCFGRLYNDRT